MFCLNKCELNWSIFLEKMRHIYLEENPLSNMSTDNSTAFISYSTNDSFTAFSDFTLTDISAPFNAYTSNDTSNPFQVSGLHL